MNWRERYAHKLLPAADAVKRVNSGDVVGVAPYTCTPYTLCEALIARVKAGGVGNLRIDHPASLVSWTEPELLGRVELHEPAVPTPKSPSPSAKEVDGVLDPHR